MIIDHGKAIAAGTPTELKQRAGHSVVEVHVRDPQDIVRVAAALAELGDGEPQIDEATRRVSMTVPEGTAQLIAELRHRGIFQHPQVRVSVREYASHAVLVSGLVGDPGTKILRREAIPLYVVIAEAQPKPEAGRAVVISHATGKTMNVDLGDAAGLNTLVQAGDVVNLVVRPPEFFYVGGEIASPGQKDFHSVMTLTQALLAAGGVTAQAGGKVGVSSRPSTTCARSRPGPWPTRCSRPATASKSRARAKVTNKS